jgi:hypothetical protein
MSFRIPEGLDKATIPVLIENPQIEIKGYINEVKDLNHFESMNSAAYPK